MASSFFLLFDDIALLLDDVAVMTKVAAKKTAGVLGDDLALNANQVSGVKANRELPVVWAVAKGSLLNKVILVPIALLISAFAPTWVIPVLLILGGLFLCYEGVEKVAHSFFAQQDQSAHHSALLDAVQDDAVNILNYEREKIKGAVQTDFILSAEIIVIALGVVAAQPFLNQVIVLATVALLMTVGVYGLVAAIVKLDDMGMHLLSQTTGLAIQFKHAVGKALLWFAPFLMKALSILGTLAMFLVGGGILAHNIPLLHHLTESVSQWSTAYAAWLPIVVSTALDFMYGFISGAILVAAHTLISSLRKPRTA